MGTAIDLPLRPEMPAAQAASAVCRGLADAVEAALPGVLSDTDPEHLHDLRVAVRRSRSVLKEMGNVLAPADLEQSRQDLRWMQKITGRTRDLDVLLVEWPSLTQPVPPALAADLQPLLDLLRGERATAFDRMRRQLGSRRFTLAWDRWRDVISGTGPGGPDAGRPIGELAGGRIVDVHRTMVEMGSVIDDSSPATELHDLRKRGKELRYLLEMFGGLWPAERVKPLISSLKGLQDVLGHFQDDETWAQELCRLGAHAAVGPAGPDSLAALGAVIEELTARQGRARADFAHRFAEWSAGPDPVGVFR